MLLVLPSHELENGQQGNQDVKTYGMVAVEAMFKQTKTLREQYVMNGVKKVIKEQLFSLPVRTNVDKLSHDTKKATVNLQHTELCTVRPQYALESISSESNCTNSL